MQTINLKDIAARAGVSTTAVSNVLNAAPIRISAEKRRLIVKTARQLRYRPNLIARSLKSGKARAIGVVVPDMTTLFYPALIRLIEMELFAQGYQTLICNSGDNALCEQKHLEILHSRFIDGLIIAPAGRGANAALIRGIHAAGTPVVCVDRYLPNEKLHYVTTAGYPAARQGAAWLKKAGARNIFYLGEALRHQTIDDRLAGVKAAVRLRAGAVILCAPERSAVYKRCLGILRRRPAAAGFFFESNRFLPGFLDAARACGLLVPRDALVIGFDQPVLVLAGGRDFRAWRALSAEIPILRQDVAAMARAAAHWIKLKMSDPSAAFAPVRLPAELRFNGAQAQEGL